MGIIMDIRDDKSNPAPVRLEAACYIANQLYGKPGQRLDIDAEVKSDVFWHVGKGYVDSATPESGEAKNDVPCAKGEASGG